MPERRVPTLADAQRQVWVRSFIGYLLVGLALIFILLVTAKHAYTGLSDPSFFPMTWEKNLRQWIDSLLPDWPIFSLLWQAIPPWQPRPVLSTAPPWELLYAFLGPWGMIVVGGLLLRSASKRQAQITRSREEMEREVWREQARAARGVAPAYRGSTTVIGQAIWQEYPAPAESWSQTIRGVLILGLIVTLVGGLIVGLIVLYVEHSYFPAR